MLRPILDMKLGVGNRIPWTKDDQSNARTLNNKYEIKGFDNMFWTICYKTFNTFINAIALIKVFGGKNVQKGYTKTFT